MSIKLTLTLDSQLVQQAETYARATGRTLAEVIENALKATIQPTAKPRTFSPQVQELFGSLKAPDSFDYKQSLSDALTERYGV